MENEMVALVQGVVAKLGGGAMAHLEVDFLASFITVRGKHVVEAGVDDRGRFWIRCELHNDPDGEDVERTLYVKEAIEMIALWLEDPAA